MSTINVNYPYLKYGGAHVCAREKSCPERQYDGSRNDAKLYDLIHTNQIIMTIGSVCALRPHRWLQGREEDLQQQQQQKSARRTTQIVRMQELSANISLRSPIAFNMFAA